MKNHTLYECDVASISLPNDFRIVKPFPSLCAKIKEDMIGVNIAVDEIAWEMMLEGMEEPLPFNPQRELKVVRKGHANLLYKSFEEVVQSRVFATNDLFFRWDLLIEKDEHRAIVGILGTGDFAENEPQWRRIVESFQFK